MKRANAEGTYRRVPLPAIDEWTPADFLAADVLDDRHISHCTLSREIAQEIYQVAHDNRLKEPVVVERIREYASRGVLEAQILLGSCSTARLREGGVSLEESRKWAERAAASGDDLAMQNLASCLDEEFLLGSRRDLRVVSRSFELDQMLYWDLRAARSLDAVSLRRLGRYVGMFYSTGSNEGDDVERLKWEMLARLSSIYRGTDAAWAEFVAHFSSKFNGEPAALGALSDADLALHRRAAAAAIGWLDEYGLDLEKLRLPYECAQFEVLDADVARKFPELIERAIGDLRELAKPSGSTAFLEVYAPDAPSRPAPIRDES